MGPKKGRVFIVFAIRPYFGATSPPVSSRISQGRSLWPSTSGVERRSIFACCTAVSEISSCPVLVKGNDSNSRQTKGMVLVIIGTPGLRNPEVRSEYSSQHLCARYLPETESRMTHRIRRQPHLRKGWIARSWCTAHRSTPATQAMTGGHHSRSRSEMGKQQFYSRFLPKRRKVRGLPEYKNRCGRQHIGKSGADWHSIYRDQPGGPPAPAPALPMDQAPAEKAHTLRI